MDPVLTTTVRPLEGSLRPVFTEVGVGSESLGAGATCELPVELLAVWKTPSSG